MVDNNPVLLRNIQRVATALGADLLQRTAFVGGVTTGLFITDDTAKEDVRYTDDVDLIVDIISYGKWALLQEELLSKGFSISPDDDVFCRMRLGPLKVDFMPDDEKILGFSNRWYAEGLSSAVDHEIADGLIIRILTPPLFIATKLEAFWGRGADDLMMSQDLEDIIILLDGRPELLSEIQKAKPGIREYIADQFRLLMKQEQFEFTVEGHLRGDSGRIELVHARMEEVVGAD